MPFGRSWAGRWLGASGAAIAVPTGLVLTIVVVASIAGGGDLGGLGQLTRGPEIPGVATGEPVREAPLDGGLPVLPHRAARTRRVERSAVAPAPSARRQGSSGPARSTPTRTTPSTPTTPPSRPPTTPAGTPTTPPAAPVTTAAPPVTTPARPATRPNPLREGVQTVQGVVTTLPLIGPPVADAVGSVADLILPPLPGRTAPSP
jgi:hypothetical protein